MKNLNEKDCEAQCRKNRKCTSFVWNPNLGNECFLKNNINVSKSDAVLSKIEGIVCGIIEKKILDKGFFVRLLKFR